MRIGFIGLGAMGFSSVYGQSDDDESIATIRRARGLGREQLVNAGWHMGCRGGVPLDEHAMPF